MLALKGENHFRVRAYEHAAGIIEDLTEDVKDIAQRGALTEIEGIGKDLAEKINDIITGDTTALYEDLKKEIPSGLLELLRVPGLGPKTVKLIYDRTKIDSVEKLEKAAKTRQLAELPGIREKTIENIIHGIGIYQRGQEAVLNPVAHRIAGQFVDSLKNLKEVGQISVAGSLRREKGAVRDIDILIAGNPMQKIIDEFVKLPIVKETRERGPAKSSVIARENNIQVDLRIVEKQSFGAALLYFTGSKEFNIKLRESAIAHGYKLNEYGVFDGKEKCLAGKTEEEVFALLGMDYIPPELREDRGEIDAAISHNLPRLVELSDIKGDLHVHSTYSDGLSTIEEDAAQAQALGYRYIAVCDHSQSLHIAKGLSRNEIHKKSEEIRALNKKYNNFRILCGTEVDINNDGSLDYPDETLKEFDLVVAAVHSGLRQSKKQLTKRIVSACKNKYAHIIAHPTGKLAGQRDAYDIDLNEVFKAAADYNTALEINSYPQRLDLNDTNAMAAKKRGVKIAIDTDSHQFRQMEAMGLGVNVGRRAWLTKNDVINCMGLEELMKWLEK
jgi:DNA polymerase (family 10)